MGLYPYKKVELKHNKSITFVEWKDRIEQSFEKHYYVSKMKKINSDLHNKFHF